MKTNSYLLYVVVIFFLFILFSKNSFSQNKKLITKTLNENVIYGNASIGRNYSNGFTTVAVYYERMLMQEILGENILPFAKIGIGRYYSIDERGEYIVAQYGFLLGTRTHHLEIASGLKYYYSGIFKGKLPFSSLVGWRIQKPGGLFIFRTGIGYPEYVYFGLGLSF